MQHGDIMTSFQPAITGGHWIMKRKAFGIAAALAALVWTGTVAFAQRQSAPANPADISAMMAALPDKPYATPQSLRHVLVLGRALGWVHTSIPLAAKMVEY